MLLTCHGLIGFGFPINGNRKLAASDENTVYLRPSVAVEKVGRFGNRLINANYERLQCR